MDSKTTYEILIAEKVQHLPVPDMADAIWVSIELQLDADTSADGEDNSPSNKPSGKGGASFGRKLFFFGCFVFIIGVMWLNNKEKKQRAIEINLPNNYISQPASTIKKDSSQTINIPKENDIDKPNSLPLIIPKANKQPVFIDSARNSNDSLNITPPLVLPDNDTASSKVIQKPDSLAAIPVEKKPKGVKGISNADYKIISGKKDSLKKNK